MAALVPTAGYSPRYNVSGSFREQFYPKMTITTSGDTLLVGLNEVTQVLASTESGGITEIVATAVGLGGGTSIAFTATAGSVANITVIGH